MGDSTRKRALVALAYLICLSGFYCLYTIAEFSTPPILANWQLATLLAVLMGIFSFVAVVHTGRTDSLG
jgi:hypothetical protein